MFTEEETAYLRSQPLARLATINEDGQPDVVPVAFEYDGTHFWVGGVGTRVLATRKFRNITAANPRARPGTSPAGHEARRAEHTADPPHRAP
ncbi:pyridoxamine 5'-phosphate oxidase family protein [Lentzea sp.]|uniref:pyridoxamine 5'-phosphate oxidase family protein n=1 Tax=Lentzea sp. TaxID=56099 RepID=UPI002B851A9E|nr:pyridoxamine 5'-phosphate oxidase family protein [Lentzea sp.]HUQ57241.1 pyridoxamine 5'-phosphate oxidase family protein [Lentzea sp.]